MLSFLDFVKTIDIEVVERTTKEISLSTAPNKTNGELEKYIFGGIEWIVINESDEKILLLSKYIIAHSQFHADNQGFSWFDNYLHKYLNETFFNRFSDNEKKGIIYNEDDEGVRYNVFLLRTDEINDHFKNPQDRIARGNDGEPISWWLEPDKKSTNIPYISETGDIIEGGSPANERLGVRPALWFKKGGISFTIDNETVNESPLADSSPLLVS